MRKHELTSELLKGKAIKGILDKEDINGINQQMEKYIERKQED